MRLLLKLLLGLLICVGALVAAGYLYFLYVPSVDPPLRSGVFSQHTMRFDGQDRSYALYTPNTSPHNAAIFVLHGSGGTGMQMREMTAYEFDVLADEHGFVVIYPDGIDNHWNDCRGSADYAANLLDVDDPGYLNAILQALNKQQKYDVSDAFVTGLSNGGHMVYRLALESPDTFKGFAAIAANLPIPANNDCNASNTAVSMAIFNGTDDRVNPHEGGLVSIAGNDSRGQVLSSVDTIQYWVDLAKVPTRATISQHPEVDGDAQTYVEQRRWHDDSVDLRLYILHGSGHVIPSQRTRMPRLLGRAAGDISGAQQIVDFFLQRVGS